MMVLTLSDLSFSAGQKLTIDGKVNSGCDVFSINIGHGPDSVALHLNPRFKYNKDRNTLVFNSIQSGSWGKEQKEKNFPFQHDGEFKVVISFNNDEFNIKLPDGNTVSFPNRFGDDMFQHLHVDGNVRIHSFKVK